MDAIDTKTSTGFAKADAALGLSIALYLQAGTITKQNLADAIGLSRPTVSRKVSGHVGWSLEELMAVGEYLGLNASDLLPHRTDDGSWLPAPFNPAFLSRGIGKTPSPLDRNEDGVWRARQDSNLQPSDP